MSSASQQTHWRRSDKDRAALRPGKRQMDFVPSVSRSSGLDKEGDALKDFKTQQEYWLRIQAKLDDYWRKFPPTCSASDHREEIRMNILILIRKLREGIMASKRLDDFALEVYEQSLRVSTIFESPVQVTSTLAHLVPNFYLQTSSRPVASSYSSILITLLYWISSTYPSQSAFRDQLRAFSPIFPRDSTHYIWISSLAAALRSSNYAKLELLTRPRAFLPFGGPKNSQDVDISTTAMCTLVDALRDKARPHSWLIIRNSYREITCSDSTDSTEWLGRSLLLQPVTPGSKQNIDDWLRVESEKGHVQMKEGMQGKWIICKPR